MNLLLAIAALCQVSSDYAVSYIYKVQLKCQQEYIQCMVTGGDASHEVNLYNCVLERKIK